MAGQFFISAGKRRRVSSASAVPTARPAPDTVPDAPGIAAHITISKAIDPAPLDHRGGAPKADWFAMTCICFGFPDSLRHAPIKGRASNHVRASKIFWTWSSKCRGAALREGSENNKGTAAGSNFQLSCGNGLAGQVGQLIMFTQNQIVAIQAEQQDFFPVFAVVRIEIPGNGLVPLSPNSPCSAPPAGSFYHFHTRHSAVASAPASRRKNGNWPQTIPRSPQACPNFVSASSGAPCPQRRSALFCCLFYLLAKFRRYPMAITSCFLLKL